MSAAWRGRARRATGPAGSFLTATGMLLALLALAQPGDVSGDLLLPLPESRLRRPGALLCPGCNVLLVSLDTLRADHVGCYGYERDTTPRIDELCADAVRFEAAFATAPSTLPSHASMFTSLLPWQHLASFSQSLSLSEEALTLAETLRGAGFETAGFVDGGQMGPTFGLAQGFDLYASEDRRRFSRTVRDAGRWLQERARRPDETRPFFLFLHTYEVHLPYDPPPEDLERFRGGYAGPLGDRIPGGIWQPLNDGSLVLDRRDVEHLVNLYDAEIRSTDRAFGRLVDRLRALGLYESTAILVLSDHGEEFGEHGSIALHAHDVYNEVLRVPWLAKLPQGAFAGSVVQEPVSLLDLFPTLLDLVDYRPFPDGLLGLSALELLRPAAERDARPTPRAIVSQQEVTGFLKAIQTRRWKLHRQRLFSLLLDPGETIDLAHRYPGVVRALRTRMAEFEAAPSLDAVTTNADEQTLEELRALGYIR